MCNADGHVGCRARRSSPSESRTLAIDKLTGRLRLLAERLAQTPESAERYEARGNDANRKARWWLTFSALYTRSDLFSKGISTGIVVQVVRRPCSGYSYEEGDKRRVLAQFVILLDGSQPIGRRNLHVYDDGV
jgi:hypothetical protein